MHILDTIIQHKKEEIQALKKKGIEEVFDGSFERLSLFEALKNPPHPGIIAEVKKASPSKGVIREDFRPLDIAKYYEESGARAISVLTDERFFQGRKEYLSTIKANVSIPCLRKDFIIDHIQVEESNALGADAILLIVACLELSLLEELLHHVEELGMDALVEVHDEPEAEQALKVGARIIGINNRDLRDFSVSLDTTFRVMEALPSETIVVSESGIGSTDAFKRLIEHGVHGVLIGESFMRNPELLREFVSLV